MSEKEDSVVAAQDAPQFEHVVWHKDPGLRKLYLVSCFGLMVASATTGYDGSLLNTVEQFDYWEEYFNHVGEDPAQSNMLGLLTNMFTIGSIISMFIVYVMTQGNVTFLISLLTLPFTEGHPLLIDGGASLLLLPDACS